MKWSGAVSHGQYKGGPARPMYLTINHPFSDISTALGLFCWRPFNWMSYCLIKCVSLAELLRTVQLKLCYCTTLCSYSSQSKMFAVPCTHLTGLPGDDSNLILLFAHPAKANLAFCHPPLGPHAFVLQGLCGHSLWALSHFSLILTVGACWGVMGAGNSWFPVVLKTS